ncbi:MAG: class I SAM-dependent methyltransferase [Bdellovibrionota bacterium]
MADWILRLVCRAPGAVSAPSREELADPLAPLREHFPQWLERMPGARVVDFGSGWGFQSVALARLGAAEVLALEIGAEKRAFTSKAGLANLRVLDKAVASDAGRFDFGLSLDAFEHYDDPAGVLSAIHALLKPGGRLLLSFGPPWYSPWGAHLRYMTAVPWIQLFFSEDALMRARGRYRSDGARRFAEVEGGLNRMSVARFERLIAGAGFAIESRRYRCSWRMNFLAWAPLLREFFVSEVSVTARKN